MPVGTGLPRQPFTQARDAKNRTRVHEVGLRCEGTRDRDGRRGARGVECGGWEAGR